MASRQDIEARNEGRQVETEAINSGARRSEARAAAREAVAPKKRISAEDRVAVKPATSPAPVAAPKPAAVPMVAAPVAAPVQQSAAARNEARQTAQTALNLGASRPQAMAEGRQSVGTPVQQSAAAQAQEARLDAARFRPATEVPAGWSGPPAKGPTAPASGDRTPTTPAAAMVAPAQQPVTAGRGGSGAMYDQAKGNQDAASAAYTKGMGGADENRAAYDAATAAAMAGGPAAAMARADEAARTQAREQSDLAIQQAVKAGRAAGMLPGQAALAATGQAADAYAKGMDSGRAAYKDYTGLGAQLGESMASRLFSGGQGLAGVGGQQLSAGVAQDATAASERVGMEQAKIANKQANQNLFGNILGTVGGIASLFSDRRLKEGLAPTSLADSLDKIRSYTYRYRGQARPEAGVMAQDLEETAMAPAVVETSAGKMVDTRRLSTMNTAALGEHEKRLKAIERMITGLKEIDHA